MSTGNNIKKQRERRNMTQEQLAEELGFSRPYINQIENNVKTLTLPMAAAIAKILRCKVDDLVED
ncbi:MAG: helix-turn-helix domain-containing protein [Eubacterium sp.]|nr:helix-turn-helix domain-containing protein [Eubacterium sp.]